MTAMSDKFLHFCRNLSSRVSALEKGCTLAGIFRNVRRTERVSDAYVLSNRQGLGSTFQFAGSRLPATGYRTQVPGPWLPATGCRLPVTGYRLDPGLRLQVPGSRLQDYETRLQVSAYRPVLMQVHRLNSAVVAL
ncbi:hypothetical protein DNH61_15645 [Paenibacillus sambharensis]|uniref:Uncharacterized protein n=1 Tax=Paenibacillus sambharensis TaxID=1803190 RepID=A0A2W1L725_9BACL|nr:hypothetical protein DNH61_15645 [Paenibacillus sambharensis]